MGNTDPTARYLTCRSGHTYSAREPECPQCLRSGGASAPPLDAAAASMAACAASLMIEARLAGKAMTREEAIDAAVGLYHAAVERMRGAPLPRPTVPVDPALAKEVVSTRPEEMIGRVLAGRYSVETVLGRGGQAVVYRATDILQSGQVALKVLLARGRDDLWRDFLQEARAAGKVAHPSIARVLDVVEADGLRFLVSEYVRGDTLRAVLNGMGRLPAWMGVEVVRQAASGIAAAHAAKVLHTDLKPENVMIAFDGGSVGTGGIVAKVLDLGLAIVDDLDAGGTETRVGGVAGTPLYMAPEQAQALLLDARCDVYALALMLYECLAGANPFGPFDSVPKVFARKLQGAPPPVSRANPLVPRELDALLVRSLAPNREERPRDASEFLRALPAVPLPTDDDMNRT